MYSKGTVARLGSTAQIASRLTSEKAGFESVRGSLREGREAEWWWCCMVLVDELSAYVG